MKSPLSLSFFRHFEAGLDTTDSSVRRKRGAAICATWRSRSAAHQIDTTVVTTFSHEIFFPALAATGRRHDARLAANDEQEARHKRIEC